VAARLTVPNRLTRDRTADTFGPVEPQGQAETQYPRGERRDPNDRCRVTLGHRRISDSGAHVEERDEKKAHRAEDEASQEQGDEP
jgi:hypothetical protein